MPITSTIGAFSDKTFKASALPSGLVVDGVTVYESGQTATLTSVRRPYELLFNPGTYICYLLGAQAARAGWPSSSGNYLSGQGGETIVTLTFTEPTTLYGFVGEGDFNSIDGLGGAGGGSTDLRTQTTVETNYLSKSFFDEFAAGMQYSIAVGGGGGGAHGAQYGYLGQTNYPGSGAISRFSSTYGTSASGGNDAGWTQTGGDTVLGTFGRNGGSSTDSSYTVDGRFGGASLAGSIDGIYFFYYTGLAGGQQNRMTGCCWPNGGSGTTFANGGGGGGYWGGACNWPNGGGGSNYVDTSYSAYVSHTYNNGSVSGSGQLIIEVQ